MHSSIRVQAGRTIKVLLRLHSNYQARGQRQEASSGLHGEQSKLRVIKQEALRGVGLFRR